MENEFEPKRTISLIWDDPWKNTRKDGKRSPAVREDLCFYSDISRTERPKMKKTEVLKIKGI